MGEVLGRYHIISELGRGGMGVVYKALDPKLERFIAIKCLSEELSADEIVVARFLREARNVAALNHPNIAQIFIADEHDGKPYFVMEYVDGESLAEFVDREGQCSPEMARRVTEQAANALAAAAEEGIVHRDVKPGNIMIDRRGRAVLTDFGIACAVAEQAGSGSDTIMGTPGYLPPEALSGGPVDSRSDMFALGAVYYEMLVGERLMPGRDLKEIYTQFANNGFPDLSPVEGKVDDRVVDILRKLLAVQPQDRYADWPALLADMAPLKTGQTGPVKRSNTGPSTAEREVTEALATARTVPPTQATATVPEATAVFEEQNPRQHPVVIERRKALRGGRLVAVFAVLVLALAATGFGLAKMAPATWERMTAWLPGSDVETTSDSTVAGVTSGPVNGGQSGGAGESDATSESVGAGQAARAGLAMTDETPNDAAASESPSGEARSSGAGFTFDVSESAEDSAIDADFDQSIAGVSTEEGRADGAGATQSSTDGSQSGAPAQGTDQPAVSEPEATNERSLAMVDATAAEATVSSAPARSPVQPAPPPSGIVVIGVGDPVIADPMVREIESALREGNLPLVQRSFVSGYRNHIQGEELDLAGLAGPALDAGARYVVLARALPAGERELQYYNRVETAFIAQLEAVTYDLHAKQQLGHSPVEQIEFTSLNATRRAVDSVRPWLPGIRDQFD